MKCGHSLRGSVEVFTKFSQVFFVIQILDRYLVVDCVHSGVGQDLLDPVDLVDLYQFISVG